MRIALIATALTCAAATLAQAEQVPNDDRKAPEAEKPICRTQKATGSRLRTTKTCMTRTEWKEHERQIEKTMQLRGGPDQSRD